MSCLLRMRYDKGSDVLYLVVRHEAAARGVEDQSGIVWRYDHDGRLIGATVMDYRERWKGKLAQLVSELSERFHIPSRDIEQVLEAA